MRDGRCGTGCAPSPHTPAGFSTRPAAPSPPRCPSPISHLRLCKRPARLQEPRWDRAPPAREDPRVGSAAEPSQAHHTLPPPPLPAPQAMLCRFSCGFGAHGSPLSPQQLPCCPSDLLALCITLSFSSSGVSHSSIVQLFLQVGSEANISPGFNSNGQSRDCRVLLRQICLLMKTPQHICCCMSGDLDKHVENINTGSSSCWPALCGLAYKEQGSAENYRTMEWFGLGRT